MYRVLRLLVLSTYFISCFAALTGDHICNKDFCFYISLDDSNKTATVQVMTSPKIGWLGLGVGHDMIHADLTVMWLTKDASNIILSRRHASGYSLPSLVGNQSALILRDGSGRFVSNLSSSVDHSPSSSPFIINGTLTFSFTRPQALLESTLDTHQTDFIWAFGVTKPLNDTIDSPFTQHTSFGSFRLDLSKPITDTTVPVSGYLFKATGEITGDDYILFAHAIIMFIAWGFVVPIAVFIARFGRRKMNWVKLHYRTQLFGAGILIFSAFWMGFYSSNISGTGHLRNNHQILGLVIFLLFFLIQLPLGWLIHHLYDKNRTHRPIRNFLHMFLGWAILITGFVQMNLGLDLLQVGERWIQAYDIFMLVWAVVFVAFTSWQLFGWWRDSERRKGQQYQSTVVAEDSSTPVRSHESMVVVGPGILDPR